MAIKSPCIGICKLDEKNVCVGCYRHQDEIRNWIAATDDSRLEILQNTQRRKNGLDIPPTSVTYTKSNQRRR